jgi:hypothetical protein
MKLLHFGISVHIYWAKLIFEQLREVVSITATIYYTISCAAPIVRPKLACQNVALVQ